MSNTAALPLDFPRAFAAIRELLRDPDETSHVFTIIESLSGRSPEYVLGLFNATADGRRLLATRESIVPILADSEALRAMPAGSMGHAYLAFVEAEGINARGLVAASDEGKTNVRVAGSDGAYVHERMRDTHDLWHALTGYQGDVLGEIALLAFTLTQTRNPGVAVIALAGFVQIRKVSGLRFVTQAFQRGLRAQSLPAVDWKAMLPLPLSEVRSRLNISAPPVYTPVRSDALRERGVIGPRKKMRSASATAM